MTLKPDTFAGMTVAITGGTSGIGGATALAFAQLGARVLSLGLNAGGPDAPAHENVACQEMDVRDREALAASINGLGQLDVLVNCAGISRDRDEWNDASFDEYTKSLEDLVDRLQEDKFKDKKSFCQEAQKLHLSTNQFDC